MLDDLKYLCDPTEYHEKRVMVKFVTDRGVSHEFVRHRHFSFAQESTRYCNYSKDKFDSEITYIIPSWLKTIGECTIHPTTSLKFKSAGEMMFVNSMLNSELNYMQMIENKFTPQQARQVLPMGLKTELNMCGFISDWEEFLKLRDDKAHAHPDAYALAHQLGEKMREEKLL